MLLLQATLLALSLVSPAISGPARRSPRVVHEKRDSLPAKWARTRRLGQSDVMQMRFALKQSNLDKLDDFLNDVAHPESPFYGQHWTALDVAKKFAPSTETIDAVKEWLADSGIDGERLRLTPSKGFIEVEVTAAEAEALLDTEYHLYQHDAGAEHVGMSCSCSRIASVPDRESQVASPTLFLNMSSRISTSSLRPCNSTAK